MDKERKTEAVNARVTQEEDKLITETAELTGGSKGRLIVKAVGFLRFAFDNGLTLSDSIFMQKGKHGLAMLQVALHCLSEFGFDKLGFTPEDIAAVERLTRKIPAMKTVLSQMEKQLEEKPEE